MSEKKRCPNCGQPIQGHPNKRFCGQRCKDRWHNVRNPRGKFAHLAKQEIDANFVPDDHPFSSEALGQWE